MKFDENFKKSATELNENLKNIYYYLTITSQTTATIFQKGYDAYKCSIQPTEKTGVYIMTINYPEGPKTVKLVITPNGEIVTEGALVIFTLR